MIASPELVGEVRLASPLVVERYTGKPLLVAKGTVEKDTGIIAPGIILIKTAASAAASAIAIAIES
jgi:hypothetical protein